MINPEIQIPPLHWGCRSLLMAHVDGMPEKVNYEQWLRDQTPERQDAILGPARARLFRDGVSLKKMVNDDGEVVRLRDMGKQGSETSHLTTKPVSEWTPEEKELVKHGTGIIKSKAPVPHRDVAGTNLAPVKPPKDTNAAIQKIVFSNKWKSKENPEVEFVRDILASVIGRKRANQYTLVLNSGDPDFHGWLAYHNVTGGSDGEPHIVIGKEVTDAIKYFIDNVKWGREGAKELVDYRELAALKTIIHESYHARSRWAGNSYERSTFTAEVFRFIEEGLVEASAREHVFSMSSVFEDAVKLHTDSSYNREVSAIRRFVGKYAHEEGGSAQMIDKMLSMGGLQRVRFISNKLYPDLKRAFGVDVADRVRKMMDREDGAERVMRKMREVLEAIRDRDLQFLDDVLFGGP